MTSIVIAYHTVVGEKCDTDRRQEGNQYIPHENSRVMEAPRVFFPRFRFLWLAQSMAYNEIDGPIFRRNAVSLLRFR